MGLEARSGPPEDAAGAKAQSPDAGGADSG